MRSDAANFRWPSWIAICDEHGIVRPISRKGRSPDNSRAEGFFGRLEVEFFYGRGWDDVGMREFMEMLDAYLVWYRDKRRKSDLGYMSRCSTAGNWDWRHGKSRSGISTALPFRQQVFDTKCKDMLTPSRPSTRISGISSRGAARVLFLLSFNCSQCSKTSDHSDHFLLHINRLRTASPMPPGTRCREASGCPTPPCRTARCPHRAHATPSPSCAR